MTNVNKYPIQRKRFEIIKIFRKHVQMIVNELTLLPTLKKIPQRQTSFSLHTS